jgi:organic hydroperoxide reductase OsmC/OhrA
LLLKGTRRRTAAARDIKHSRNCILIDYRCTVNLIQFVIGTSGVRLKLVLQSFLQDPHFIHRVESGTPGTVNDFELATRLSYFLWKTTPDDELLETAERGELSFAAALASCTAVTMEMYADRKGWDLGDLEVCVDFELDERGSSDRFDVALRLSKELSADQVERLQRIAGRCPVHRVLAAESEVTVADHVELV